MSFSSDYQGHRSPKVAKTRTSKSRKKAQSREDQVHRKIQGLVTELISSGVLGSKKGEDFQVSISGHFNNGPEPDDDGMQNFVYVSVTRIPRAVSGG